MIETLQQLPAMLCAISGAVVCFAIAGVVKLSALAGFDLFEREFVDHTDKAIKEGQDKINKRKNAGRVWGQR